MSLPHSDIAPTAERPWWRYILVILLFLIPLALYLGAPLVVQVPEHYQHILLTITAVMGIHVLDRLFLVKDTDKALNRLIHGVREDIRSDQGIAIEQIAKDTENLMHGVREDIKKDRGTALESISGNTEKLMHGVREDISRDTEKLMQGVREDISRQTSSLLHTSQSLEAMSRSGIIHVYTSRKEAASDIKEDVTNPANSKIRLIGISLNDFVQGIDQTLSESWQIVEAYVRRQRRIDDRERGLDIRVLIIDPACFGATLRSGSESASSTALADRLENDVRAAARDLSELEADAARYKADTGVTFECRLYRLPPILFLCSVDSSCYVQQYHFWSHRDNRTPLPVLKFRKIEAGAVGYQYHSEMEHHFDWIWKHASLPVSDYLDCASTGTEKALNQCSVVNIYTDTDKAKERMIYLLKNARRKVSIQGISLQSFFESGKLYDALYNVVSNGVMDLEVLLLDPDSDQAKYRSYRERLFASGGDQSYGEYIAQSQHETSELYQNTNRTIERIEQMLEHITQRNAGLVPKLKVGLYASAPACFALRIDDRVLVEQYHYGKIVPEETPAILGKDMPLFEYWENTPELYKSKSDPLRMPFGLLVNHLEYALAQSKLLNFPIHSPKLSSRKA